MEGTSEVNDVLENPVEALHLKRKENEHSLQSDDCNVVELSAMSVSPEWPEHLSSSRFPELALEAFEGNHLVRCTSSQSGFEHLSTTPLAMNDADTMVEELTLVNYKNPNLPVAGCSTSVGDEMPLRKSLWQNLYRLAGEPRDAMFKERSTLHIREDVENSFPSHVQAERPIPHKQLGQDYSKVSDNLIQGDSHAHSSNLLSRFPMGIRTKVLPASGFPQFLVKNSLKDKGIVYRHPGSYDAAPGSVVFSHTNERSSNVAGKTSAETHCSSAKPEDMSLYGGNNGSKSDPNSYVDGVSLREWLKGGRHKINKAGRLLIFKQILDLVDTFHSQGVALKHLRPSYFRITSSIQVKYVGSFIPQSQMGVPVVANDIDTISSDHQIKRKRSLELGQQTHEFVSIKHQKHSEHLQFGSQQYPFGTKGVWKGDPIKEIGTGHFKAWNSGCDFREQLKIGEDHNPRGLVDGPISAGADRQHPVFAIVELEERWYASPEELSGCVCSSTSNIYSLGVLLFELFCYFETWEVHAAAMSDLRHRILPPKFLSESPKEAGFCLWLLHPEPSLRPKSREVLLCDLISGTEDLSSADHVSASIDEEDDEADLLLQFLLSAKEQMEKHSARLVKDIGCLREDIGEVERRRLRRMEFLSHARDSVTSINDISYASLHNEPLHSQPILNMNEARLMKNFDQLESAYFSMRSKIELPATNSAAPSDNDILTNRDRFPTQNSADKQYAEKESDCLGAFFDGLCKYARYSKFKVHGTLRNGDSLNSANVIFSLSFDRDEEYFAAAGVSKKIKIYEFSSLLKDTVDIHYPVVEMSSKSRLSCVCWNSYIKNYLASTDYDGVVQLWDASTGQGFTRYSEHQKRAWSVDFSQVDPTRLASGSDDCSAKLWSINEKNCTETIKNIANVCCVQFSSHSSHLLAFGSADHKIYCYDLRNTRIPWCTLVGHMKAVSYVKFVDSETLVSASTDNTLKLWDLNKTSSSGLSTSACSLTLSGHTNEKNFVGLSVSDGYIACGSETNEVFAYYKSLPMPITSYKFGSLDTISGQESGDDEGQFVSSVCWGGKSNMVVAANSTGSIKLLQMV